MAQKRTAEIEGRRVAYLEAGKGPLVLVLLHGIGSSARSWASVLPLLAAHGRCVAWDMPGYGGSDPLQVENPEAGDYARVLDGLWTALGVGRAVVVGHSLGAIPAAEAAWTWPDRVAGLVLANPAQGYGAADRAAWPESVTARIRGLEEEGAEAFAAARAPRLCAEEAPAEAVDAVRREMARVRMPGYGQAAGLLARSDIAPKLAQVVCPLTITVGAEDRITPPERVRPLASLRPDVRYVELPGIGHAGYVEAPERYARPIIEMIERVR